MPQAVSDVGSNAEENIAQAAKVVGRSSHRRKVFDAIYTGQRRAKSISHLMEVTNLPRTRVLDAGKKLANNHLVTPTKQDGETAYEKIGFFQSNKRKILSLVDSPAKLKQYPTKRNPGTTTALRGHFKVQVSFPKKRQQARHITIDSIDSFSKIKKSSAAAGYTKMPETRFKAGIAGILNEPGVFKDWGGENRDLASTRLRLAGKRRSAAFAFKGPGTNGKLTPGKMGKNGDQIQRLVTCPAEVFFVQYWAEIDDAVLRQLEQLCQLKSYLEGREIWYGVIDGVDSTRLIEAYPGCFDPHSHKGGR